MDDRLLEVLRYLKEKVYPKNDSPDCEIKIRNYTRHNTVTIKAAMQYSPLWFASIRKRRFRRKLRKLFKKLDKNEYGDLAHSSLDWDERAKPWFGLCRWRYQIKIKFSSYGQMDGGVEDMSIYYVSHTSTRHEKSTESVIMTYYLEDVPL